MRTVTERDMAVRLAVAAELKRLFEHVLVAIAGRVTQHQPVTFGDLASAKFGICHGRAHEMLDRRHPADRLVDQAWDHFRGRHYRATFEILLNYLGREEHHGAGDWRLEMSRAWDGVWSRIFADATLPRKRSLMLQHFTVSALSGLASTLMLHGGDARLPKWELDVLKATLLRQLTAG